jgi:quercetin dioxygenase-like cupin family protein
LHRKSASPPTAQSEGFIKRRSTVGAEGGRSSLHERRSFSKMNARVNWRQIPWEAVNDNISRKVVIGERLMMIYYRFQPFQQWPTETHAAEQCGYILKGKIILRLDDGKQELQLGPGDGYLIASNRAHSWQVLDEEVQLVDVFSPPRKELIHDKYAPMAHC